MREKYVVDFIGEGHVETNQLLIGWRVDRADWLTRQVWIKTKNSRDGK